MPNGLYVGLSRYDARLTPDEPKDWVCPDCGHECGENEARDGGGLCGECGHVLVEDDK